MHVCMYHVCQMHAANKMHAECQVVAQFVSQSSVLSYSCKPAQAVPYFQTECHHVLTPSLTHCLLVYLRKIVGKTGCESRWPVVSVVSDSK